MSANTAQRQREYKQRLRVSAADKWCHARRSCVATESKRGRRRANFQALRPLATIAGIGTLKPFSLRNSLVTACATTLRKIGRAHV